MTETLKSLLDSLRDEFDTTWGVEKVELNGRYGAFQETPLHVFSTRGDVNACRTLIEAGAELNFLGEHRFTALHEAVHQGHVSVVELLLRSGADSSLTTDIGTTEFLAAEYPEIERLLKQNESD